MSADSALAAIQAIEGSTVKQSLGTQNQAIHTAHQAALAQRFEHGLVRASEVSASSFQAMTESRRKSVDAGYQDRFKTSDIAQIEVRPSQDSDRLMQEMGSYLDGLHQRNTDFYQRASELATTKPAPEGTTAVSKPENLTDAAIAKKSDAAGEFTPAQIFKMTIDSYKHGLEVKLVSKLANKSSRTVNDLMKGQ